MKAEYTSGYEVAKRPTIYIDVNDPRVRDPIEAKITAARLGAELVIVNDSTLSIAGVFSSIKASTNVTASAASRPAPGINPTSENFIKPSALSNLDAEWNDETLVITFDFDFSIAQNKYVQGFRYKLTSGGVESILIPHTNVNKTGLLQTIEFTAELNQTYFGGFKESFSLLTIYAYDSFGNISETASLSVIPSYVPDLPAPIITVSAINQGYSVDWEQPGKAYRYIAIEEVISNASTDPGSGYNAVYLDEIKPATIFTSDLQARWVKARFTNRVGSYGPYSIAHKVTPESPVIVDITAPDAPASGSVTAGIDNSAGATIGFNAFVDISWSAVSDPTLKGYRIRFRENATSNPYSYVDSPGTGTTFRLNGLSIGTTYEVAIASYDEFNNTSSTYTSIGTATATGTPFIGKNVTTVGYFGASATGDTGTFKFGYGVQDSGGTKRGLVFNANNYWYIDSAQSALFKLGGDTNNYIQWDGSSFIVQGDIRARGGNFQGNVQIISGGSIYSGALTQGGELSGAGFILNNSGLTFNSSTVNGTTIINGETGLFTTKSANIGGWLISPTTNPNTLYQTFGTSPNVHTVKLDANEGSVSISGSGYTAGIGSPDANNIVFWAGATRSLASSFYVKEDGTLKALQATLRGSLETGDSSVQNVMKFGAGVGDSGEDGIHLNSTNYWYVFNGSPGAFSFGGILKGSASQVRLDLGASSQAGTTQFFIDNMPRTDDDSWAGDPTITIREDNRIVKGRRIMFDSSLGPNEEPTPVSLIGGVGLYYHEPTDTQRPVKAGDLILVEEA